MLTGRLISGTEAAETGLMSRAQPADEVLPAASSGSDRRA
jgi:enoyl-CoA hydratase/carnithine racemase